MKSTRRRFLMGTGASLAAIAGRNQAFASTDPHDLVSKSTPPEQALLPGDLDRAKRMKWWHEARFGMFVHFGVYSQIARHEWVMEDEAIPISEYKRYAEQFKPLPNCPRIWAKLAKEAGMKYMVMTAKHHEGFCNFDSKLTNYSAPHYGPGRDLVREFVEAARAEDLRVGIYYSLMDWHHPDGQRCKTDEAARQRFVSYTHGLIRELMTNYGEIDILWYDGILPLNATTWESVRMNEMVYALQPGIVINNRNGLPGDFSTPEQNLKEETGGRAWESCMTMNWSFGYQRADDDWKTTKTVVRDLIECAHGGGNYLLDIGPRGDGSVPEEEVRILTEVGQWLEINREAVFETDLCQPSRHCYALFTRRGNTLYMNVHFWPGEYVAIVGLMTRIKSARLLKTGQKVEFNQDRFRAVFTGLPLDPPDYPVTTIAIECESEPIQDHLFVRSNMPREHA